MFDLTGKVALITGSSRGIGRSIAECMARAGAKVVISSRKADACAAVAEELGRAGFEAMAVPCNISRKEELRTLVDTTLETWGRIDVLVCNAATNPVYGPSIEVSDEAFDKILGTNVRSTFWLCNMVLPQMAERGDGAVVLLSSITALTGNPVIGIYGVSKAAEAQLARNLAVEWGPRGIRVNCILPGWIETPFNAPFWSFQPDPGAAEQSLVRSIPMRRQGEPADVAGVVLFLASAAARYVTGGSIVVDGGYSAV